MESKYYTPTIEEIHIGLEYEWFSADEWHKCEFINSAYTKLISPNIFDEEGWYFNIVSEIQENNIRVKKLDHDDIISEGWVEDADDSTGYIFETKYQTFILEHSKNQEYLIRTLDGNRKMMFNIRNKSELRMVMNLIGIK